MDAPYSLLEQLGPGIARLLAPNPSAFTYTGTQTYLVGQREVAVIDPGPDLPEHVEALAQALDGREVVAIVCTHTHRDHSPAARPLADKTGARIIRCAPLAIDALGPRADAAFDTAYVPDQVLEDGGIIVVDGEALIAVATPGHTSNHLCFAFGDALFTGDHVMGWSTTVVVPPDGDMAAYMRSLDKLQQREERIYYPAHGGAVTDPQHYLRHLIDHRQQRERQIGAIVKGEPSTIGEIVSVAYPGLDARLISAAGGSVLAHLLDLERRGLVHREEDRWTAR